MNEVGNMTEKEIQNLFSVCENFRSNGQIGKGIELLRSASDIQDVRISTKLVMFYIFAGCTELALEHYRMLKKKIFHCT
ncbi:MAG: hypothetical protein IE909_12435 [Campylobacterales bacterium]|nr:hypothetical protein [Campylobacterales bacterium]